MVALQRAADSAKDNKGSVLEVKRSGSVGGNTRGGRGFGRGDRQSTDRVRSGRGRHCFHLLGSALKFSEPLISSVLAWHFRSATNR